MPTYIVESYSAGGIVPQQRERAQRVAKTRAGIQYVRTTFLPGDETLLHLFEATSADVLREAVIVAGLECDRIVEAVEASAQADEGGVDRSG